MMKTMLAEPARVTSWLWGRVTLDVDTTADQEERRVVETVQQDRPDQVAGHPKGYIHQDAEAEREDDGDADGENRHAREEVDRRA